MSEAKDVGLPVREIASKELVEAKLNPTIKKDHAGFKRTVFNLNGVYFSFRGAEELPEYPTLASQRITLLGDSPTFVEPEKFEQYKTKFQTAPAESGTATHYLTTRSLNGVLELARSLGNSNGSQGEILEEINQGVYSAKTLQLLDNLISACYVGDDGTLLEQADPNGEALVVLSLLGDEQARGLIAKKEQALKNSDKEKFDTYHARLKELGETTYANVEALKPNELVCVHATRFIPKTDPSGEFVVPTSFDATGGKAFRNSVHTSLNHKVEAVNLGFADWSDADYTLIAPFPAKIEANGVPACLNTVDTWWAQDPGELLVYKLPTTLRSGF